MHQPRLHIPCVVKVDREQFFVAFVERKKLKMII